jgi:hypothetical protein
MNSDAGISDMTNRIQAWWYMPVISALGRLRQEKHKVLPLNNKVTHHIVIKM